MVLEIYAAVGGIYSWYFVLTLILWHTLTGGLTPRWANKPLNTFTDALEAFRTAIYFRFVCCGPTTIGRYSLLIKQVRCSVWA